MKERKQAVQNGSVELLDLTPIAVQVGTMSQVVMTARCWESRFAPDASRHSIREWIEMRTTAPQLEAMVIALLESSSGEDRTPCQFGFTTKSKYLAGGEAQMLAVGLTRFHRRRDFVVVDVTEARLAELVAEYWADRHVVDPWGRKYRLATELCQILRNAKGSPNTVAETEATFPTAIAS